MRHAQTEEEWQEEMGKKVLEQTRQEVYLDLRFLKIALSALNWKANPALKALATDGAYLYFAPEHVIRVYKQNPAFLDRAYLHSVLHCLFSHLWIAGNRERNRWNLACDIGVEYVIDKMEKPCTRRILSFLRKNIYTELEELQKKEKTALSAAVIYRQLGRYNQSELTELAVEFYTDDHSFWPKEKQGGMLPSAAQKNQEMWKKIARQTAMEQERQGSKESRQEGEKLLAALALAGKKKRTYGDFLRKFAMLREELRIDPEEFDMNFYSYGLRLYGNLPLVEPIESREAYKIREFVIAVDTSDSTRGELVEAFLRETFSILNQKNYFFGDARIHVVQCDNRVQRDDIITNTVQLEQFLKNYTIEGGGGTDFRPAFAYVGELLKEGKLQNLCGMLYFTDGKGIYPKQAPPYKTAFLFPEDCDMSAVPPWAMRAEVAGLSEIQ